MNQAINYASECMKKNNIEQIVFVNLSKFYNLKLFYLIQLKKVALYI